MSGPNRIAAAFEGCGKRAAFMPYLMGGFPDLDASAAIGEAYGDGGADLVELGTDLCREPFVLEGHRRHRPDGLDETRVLELDHRVVDEQRQKLALALQPPDLRGKFPELTLPAEHTTRAHGRTAGD